MRTVLLTVAFAAALTVAEQPAVDLALRRALAGSTPAAYATRAESTAADLHNVVIRQKDGTRSLLPSCIHIGGDIYTARVSLAELAALAADTSVVRLAASTRHRLLTDRTREATGADRVQAAEALDAPFTGRGVLIAVIDEGFEYRHAAFLDADGQSRVRGVWNRRVEGSVPTADIPTGGDGYSGTGGHATHTACIAAGRAAGTSAYYGMAPDAALVFIPSNLDNAELLEDAAYVASVAREAGVPWIINISFGSHEGSHDGLDLYSRTMDSLLRASGGFLVAAMGNEGGDKLHAAATPASPTDTLRFLITPTGAEAMIDLWAQADDSLRHFTMRPFVLVDGAVDYTAVDLSTAFLEEISPDNRKQHGGLLVGRSALSVGGTYCPVGIEVCGASGISVHAWTDDGMGVFSSPDARFVTGDDHYLVCEGGACVPSAIAVGAYTAANTTARLNGGTVSFSQYTVGQICPFSNSGPYLGSESKPTVVAPGAVVRSAVSKAAPDFSARASTLVEKQTVEGEAYYYGYKSGTSMSTPVVTGILALWLEACPTLTQADVLEILRTTSRPEADALRWGYGRIDAYEGLKAALDIAAQTGIERTRQSDFPAALRRTPSGWDVLACRDEAALQWRICDAGGRTLLQGAHPSPAQAASFHISTNALPHGVYILRIHIGAHEAVRKFVQ